MNKAKQILLKALSSPDSRLDVEKSRKLMNLKALDPLKPFYRTLDTKFYREGREIPFGFIFRTVNLIRLQRQCKRAT